MNKQIKRALAFILSVIMILGNSAVLYAQETEKGTEAVVIKEFTALKAKVSSKSYQADDASRPMSKKALKLPEKLSATLENGEVKELAVTWNCTDSKSGKDVKYSGEAGQYTFKPVWDKDAYVLAEDKSAPSISVKVIGKEVETEMETESEIETESETNTEVESNTEAETIAETEGETAGEKKENKPAARAVETITVTTTGLDGLKVGQVVNGAVVYTIADGTFAASIVATDFTVTGLPNWLSAAAAVRASDNTVTIAITGTPVAVNTDPISLGFSSNIPMINTTSQSSNIVPAGTISVSAVAKGDGAAVSSVPTVSATPGKDTISVVALTSASAVQTVEYAISTSNAAVPTQGWQDGVTFTGLTPSTTYYVFARTKATAEYEAGSAQMSAGITTAAATAAVPAITAQPAGANYSKNDKAAALSVTAAVTDGGTLSYQWYENATNKNTGGTVISGAVNASYTPETKVIGTTYYYVVITNTKDGVTATAVSNTAQVVVNELYAEIPDITKQPKKATYTEGDSAKKLTVTAKVADGGTLSYQWYKTSDDSNVDGKAIKGATKSSYTPSTDKVGTTYYYVVVTNKKDGTESESTSDPVKIVVKAKKEAQTPTIEKQPTGSHYRVNATATALTVTASVSDDGKLSYQWYRSSKEGTDGSAIKGATGSSYTPPTGTIATYYYYVVVTNTKDGKTASKTSSAAKVVVSKTGTTTVTGKTTKTTTAKSGVKTGDTTQAGMYVLIGLAALACIVLVKKKRA